MNSVDTKSYTMCRFIWKTDLHPCQQFSSQIDASHHHQQLVSHTQPIITPQQTPPTASIRIPMGYTNNQVQIQSIIDQMVSTLHLTTETYIDDAYINYVFLSEKVNPLDIIDIE